MDARPPLAGMANTDTGFMTDTCRQAGTIDDLEMNAIIPVAGIGKRLRPHTLSVPKALLMVGGKPIIGHILDKLKPLKLNRIIFIVGYMGDKIREHVGENYNFDAVYVEQKEQLGLGHAIWLSKEFTENEPCIIVYGDTIFDGTIPVDLTVDGLIGVKSVDDPRRFGIVELENGFIKKLIEKPEQPISNLTIVGVNLIRNSRLLFESLDHIIEGEKRTSGEFQLTDALDLMVSNGARFKTFPIDKWFDCGKVETLLSTNRELLLTQEFKGVGQRYKDCTIVPPVFIHESAKIKNSTIGPDVSIDRDSNIKNSTVSDSIINQGARVEDSRLSRSVVGANTVVKGVSGVLNIGDFSEVLLNTVK
jgi:glucose-1-phosphate thymidylyltransferase